MGNVLSRIGMFAREIAANPKGAVREALTVAVAATAALTFVNSQHPFGLHAPGWALADAVLAVTFLKTVLSALDGKQPAFGRGAMPPAPKGKHAAGGS